MFKFDSLLLTSLWWLHISFFMYRVIQEEKQILWEVIVSVIVRKNSFKPVSISEWLPR